MKIGAGIPDDAWVVLRLSNSKCNFAGTRGFDILILSQIGHVPSWNAVVNQASLEVDAGGQRSYSR